MNTLKRPGSAHPDSLQSEAQVIQAGLLGQLATARRALDITQEELAERAGVSRMTVQRAETPEAGAALSTFVLLARALNLMPVLEDADAEGHLPCEDLVHRGLSHNRTRFDLEYRDRQREAALAASWEAANKVSPAGLGPILPLLVPNATQAQASAAATTVQWLGSEVGFDFLSRALQNAGYDIVDTRYPRSR